MTTHVELTDTLHVMWRLRRLCCIPCLLQDTWESTLDAAKGTAKDIKKGAEGLGDRISGH
jgi:hypothetical protein